MPELYFTIQVYKEIIGIGLIILVPVMWLIIQLIKINSD